VNIEEGVRIRIVIGGCQPPHLQQFPACETDRAIPLTIEMLYVNAGYIIGMT
jgi:hypothetical protein